MKLQRTETTITGVGASFEAIDKTPEFIIIAASDEALALVVKRFELVAAPEKNRKVIVISGEGK